MDDRTMLELAAKAAGYPVCYEREYDTFFMRDEQSRPIWNPLTDDGDALRLAVRLGFMDSGTGFARYLGEYQQLNVSDKQEATRLAIVRAAAEIGKAKP